MEEESRQAITEREEIDGELAQFNAARAGLDAKIAEGEAAVAAQDAELRAHEEQFNALRVNEASLRERARSIKRELESAKALVTDRERRLNEINRTLERASRERDEFSGGETGMQEENRRADPARLRPRRRTRESQRPHRQSNAKANAALERIKELHKTGDRQNLAKRTSSPSKSRRSLPNSLT